MSRGPTLRAVDWLLVAIIGLFLAGAVVAQAHGAEARPACARL